MILLGSSTGTKSEFRIFEEEKFNFSLLVPVLNPKSITFSHLVPVQRPRKIEENNSKKAFLGIYPGTKSTFLGRKKISKLFKLHLVPGTTFKKI